MVEMSAQKALLDAMTLLHLNNAERDEVDDMDLIAVEALFDNASSQHHLKYSAMQKGTKPKTNTERKRPGPKSLTAPNQLKSDPYKQIVGHLNEEIITLHNEESVLVNETKTSCLVQDLAHLVREPSPHTIPVETKAQKKCKMVHEQTHYQAMLLQQLCRVTDVPDDKQDYINNLCNSVLTGAYDFCSS